MKNSEKIRGDTYTGRINVNEIPTLPKAIYRWKIVWRLLNKKIKMKLLYDPANPLLGIHPEEMKSLS